MKRYVKHIHQATVMEQVMPVLLFFWTAWFSHNSPTEMQESLKAARFLSDTTWASAFLIIGCLHCIVILRGFKHPRRYFLFFLAMLWTAWALILGSSSNFTSIGCVTYAVIALACYKNSKAI